jgi:hypothetical protein
MSASVTCFVGALMILNSSTVQLIRTNAARLANAIRSKEDLNDLATAGNFEQVFAAIEALLTHTEMYFDDELLMCLDDSNWRNFKATLLVYTLNIVNRYVATARDGSGMSRDQHDYMPAAAHM